MSAQVLDEPNLNHTRQHPYLFLHRLKKIGARVGPKGGPAQRFIGSAEIIDKQNDLIGIEVFMEVMPIMQKQGARINGVHSTQPAGEFFDYGFTMYKGYKAIWLDVEVYTEYPSQKENLRRLKLSKDDPDAFTGISVGGKKLSSKKECNAYTCYTRIEKIEGWEWSLVDKPANHLALRISDKEFEELNMNITKSVAKSEKAKKQKRNNKGTFFKSESSNCSCNSKCKDKSKLKIKEKVLQKEEDEEYEDDMDEDNPENGEDESVEDETYSEDETKMEEEGEDLEEGMVDPNQRNSAGYQGGTSMQEDLNYLKMQLDKITSALSIDKSETPTEIKDAEGNIYILKQDEPEATPETVEIEGKVYSLQKGEKPETEAPEKENDSDLEKQLKTLSESFVTLQKKLGEKEIQPQSTMKLDDEAQIENAGPLSDDALIKSLGSDAEKRFNYSLQMYKKSMSNNPHSIKVM